MGLRDFKRASSMIVLSAASLGMAACTTTRDITVLDNLTAAGAPTAHCFNSNLGNLPQQTRNIIRDHTQEILQECQDGERFVRAIDIMLPARGASNVSFNQTGWYELAQLIGTYDHKLTEQTELNARLAPNARNPETGAAWSTSEQNQFILQQQKVNGWVQTVNARIDMDEIRSWFADNAPEILDIRRINDRCQMEVRSQFKFGANNARTRESLSLMVCDEARAPQTGPLRYNLSINYQSTAPR